MTEPLTRLAAILCADVVGYARLVEADEAGTLAALKHHLSELIEPAITAHRGRIFKTTGDGLLAEFGSVVEALRCALEIQRGMAERQASVGYARRMNLRIGLNLGDVVIEDADVLGHGVNVAARLQALAQPGGICISGAVFDQIEGKPLAIATEALGETHVKGIERPVRVYQVRAAAASMVTPAAPPLTAGLAPPVLIPRVHKERPPLSIVVLPFANQGGDPAEDWFADGITEDLIAALGRLQGALVIARGTAFGYKGRPVDPREVGRELDVRYVLEGRVRRRGERMRLAAELVDAETGASVWTQSFDLDRADLDLIQEEITAQIANALRHELLGREGDRARRKTPHEASAADLVMQGWAVHQRLNSSETFQEMLSLFEAAVALDPRSASAWTGIAFARIGRVLDMHSDDRELDIREAERAIERARVLASTDVHVERVTGMIARARKDQRGARDALERALALNPNEPRTYFQLGVVCTYEEGRPEAYFSYLEEALRRSPSDPDRGHWFGVAACAAALLDRLDEAVEWARRSIEINPHLPWVRVHTASILARLGRPDEARAMLEEQDRLSSIRSIRQFRATLPSAHPEYLRLMEKTFDGLRLAGMPEE